MEKFTNLVSGGNKKLIIIFVILNIILVFFETLSIALIPLVIDFVVSSKPLLPQYLSPISHFLDAVDRKDALLYSSIFIIIIFLIKNFYVLGLNYYREILSLKLRYDLKKKIF